MLFSLLALAATPVYAPIFVGKFDPSEFPNAEKVARRMPNADLNHRIEEILSHRRCSLEGQTKARFDIVVPYAVLMDPNGKPQKVVVKEMGCEPIEQLVGEIGSELANAGDFKVTHTAGDKWYVSEAYFTRLNQEDVLRQADDNKIVCKKDRPKINSRIAAVKTCMTVAEWRLYSKDQEQLKRDFMNQDPKKTDVVQCLGWNC